MNSVLQIDQGNLTSRLAWIRAQTNLSGEFRVEQTHDRSGQPDKYEIALRAAPLKYIVRLRRSTSTMS